MKLIQWLVIATLIAVAGACTTAPSQKDDEKKQDNKLGVRERYISPHFEKNSLY